MKRYLRLIAFALVAMMLIALAGCSGATTKTQKVEAIHISYVKLPLNVPSIVEKQQQLFEKEFGKDGIKVEFPEITEGPKMTEAIASGSLDFCNALGGTSAILAAANGVDLKIIGMYSRAPKAFTIMAKDSSIQSMKDLRGKKVAGPKGTILHQLLIAGLKEQGLTINDVEFLNMGIPQGVAALMSGSVDVALVAGPAVPKALESGAHIVVTGEGILDATIVIAVSNKFLKEHPDLVKRYMKVHQQSLDFMNNNQEEVYKIAAQETSISIDNVKKMYPWYNFNPTITDADMADLIKTQDFLVENGMLTKKIDIKSLIVNVNTL